MLLDMLQEYRKSYVIPNFKIDRIKKQFLFLSDYIPPMTKQFIDNINACYKITIGNYTIYTTTHSSKLRKLATFCCFFGSFLEHAFKKAPMQLQIYYFPDPSLGIKKLIESNRTSLSPNEINSGLNYGNKIVIYRRQEAAKVLIHELIHAYGIDVGVKINKSFNIESSVPIRFTETYTELLASILFVEYARKKNRQLAFENLFKHFQMQADKIMCMFWINSKFKQDTHVFEYVIAKSALCINSDISEIEKLFETHTSKSIFCEKLEMAISKYIENYVCGFRALPKSI